MIGKRMGGSLLLLYSLLLVILLASAGCTWNPHQDLPAQPPALSVGASVLSPAGTSPSTCTNPLTASVTESPDYTSHFLATELLTKPEDHTVTVSIVPKDTISFFVVYGTSPGSYSCQIPTVKGAAGLPVNSTITGLAPDTLYYYRTCITTSDSSGPVCGPEHTFHTQRSSGSSFTFGVQADSHPEREKTLFSRDLYRQTLQNVAGDRLDFYITLGDDFSIDPLIDRDQVNAQSVNAVYLNQRTYLDTVGSSSPVFLVNGNHEQAARYLLDDTSTNAAVLAGSARMQYFPQPLPGTFYSGDSEPVAHLGLPGDYYAWTWGDSLFVVIDPYWHSPVAVDNVAGKNGHQKKDPWEITLGDTQYQWFKKTLEGSTARYKFVFTHHVLGTGRGGIEEAGRYEWGGADQNGVNEFAKMRPGWELPIQQLMAKNGVTIFFQGHDHLFVRQELDGVTYQEVPVPADPTYSMFNAEAYTSGIKLPNTGYLRVTVSPQNTTVDYVKTYLSGIETSDAKNGMVAYSYTVTGNTAAGGTL
jgi:hypothetical protein